MSPAAESYDATTTSSTAALLLSASSPLSSSSSISSTSSSSSSSSTASGSVDGEFDFKSLSLWSLFSLQSSSSLPSTNAAASLRSLLYRGGFLLALFAFGFGVEKLLRLFMSVSSTWVLFIVTTVLLAALVAVLLTQFMKNVDSTRPYRAPQLVTGNHAATSLVRQLSDNDNPYLVVAKASLAVFFPYVASGIEAASKMASAADEMADARVKAQARIAKVEPILLMYCSIMRIVLPAMCLRDLFLHIHAVQLNSDSQVWSWPIVAVLGLLLWHWVITSCYFVLFIFHLEPTQHFLRSRFRTKAKHVQILVEALCRCVLLVHVVIAGAGGADALTSYAVHDGWFSGPCRFLNDSKSNGPLAHLLGCLAGHASDPQQYRGLVLAAIFFLQLMNHLVLFRFHIYLQELQSNSAMWTGVLDWLVNGPSSSLRALYEAAAIGSAVKGLLDTFPAKEHCEKRLQLRMFICSSILTYYFLFTGSLFSPLSLTFVSLSFTALALDTTAWKELFESANAHTKFASIYFVCGFEARSFYEWKVQGLIHHTEDFMKTLREAYKEGVDLVREHTPLIRWNAPRPYFSQHAWTAAEKTTQDSKGQSSTSNSSNSSDSSSSSSSAASSASSGSNGNGCDGNSGGSGGDGGDEKRPNNGGSASDHANDTVQPEAANGDDSESKSKDETDADDFVEIGDDDPTWTVEERKLVHACRNGQYPTNDRDFVCAVFGPSNAGKSTLIKAALHHRLFPHFQPGQRAQSELSCDQRHPEKCISCGCFHNRTTSAPSMYPAMPESKFLRKSIADRVKLTVAREGSGCTIDTMQYVIHDEEEETKLLAKLTGKSLTEMISLIGEALKRRAVAVAADTPDSKAEPNTIRFSEMPRRVLVDIPGLGQPDKLLKSSQGVPLARDSTSRDEVLSGEQIWQKALNLKGRIQMTCLVVKNYEFNIFYQQLFREMCAFFYSVVGDIEVGRRMVVFINRYGSKESDEELIQGVCRNMEDALQTAAPSHPLKNAIIHSIEDTDAFQMPAKEEEEDQEDEKKADVPGQTTPTPPAQSAIVVAAAATQHRHVQWCRKCKEMQREAAEKQAAAAPLAAAAPVAVAVPVIASANTAAVATSISLAPTATPAAATAVASSSNSNSSAASVSKSSTASAVSTPLPASPPLPPVIHLAFRVCDLGGMHERRFMTENLLSTVMSNGSGSFPRDYYRRLHEMSESLDGAGWLIKQVNQTMSAEAEKMTLENNERALAEKRTFSLEKVLAAIRSSDTATMAMQSVGTAGVVGLVARGALGVAQATGVAAAGTMATPLSVGLFVVYTGYQLYGLFRTKPEEAKQTTALQQQSIPVATPPTAAAAPVAAVATAAATASVTVPAVTQVTAVSVSAPVVAAPIALQAQTPSSVIASSSSSSSSSSASSSS